MNYCEHCLNYDYCSARRMCIDPPFGYCTRYQPKSWVKMDESTMSQVKPNEGERREDEKNTNTI